MTEWQQDHEEIQRYKLDQQERATAVHLEQMMMDEPELMAHRYIALSAYCERLRDEVARLHVDGVLSREKAQAMVGLPDTGFNILCDHIRRDQQEAAPRKSE